MRNYKTIILRSRLIFIFISVFSILILCRIFFIQTFQNKKWKNQSKKLSIKYKEIKAPRGNIYSYDNELLATSLPFYTVAIDPCVCEKNYFAKNIRKLSKNLSSYFKDHDYKYYEDKIKKAREVKKRYLKINTQKINIQDKNTMLSWPIFNRGKYRGGVIFEKQEKRFKPFGNLASRSIGSINKNTRGYGIEYSFNSILKGKEGKALYQKVLGGWKVINDSLLKPINGLDIILTLDTKIQDITEHELKEALKDNDAEYGCAVIMEVETGEIKAMVNLSKIKENIYKETYNYVIGKKRDPGSTFKIVSCLALFEETDVELGDPIDTGSGKYKFFDRTMRDWKWGGFGLITVQKAIEVSSMIAIAKLTNNAFGHNPQRYIYYLDRLGFTSRLNFDILGEAVPTIKTPKNKSWSGITLPWMSTGYEIEVTPLQILTFYNAIANNGKLIKPILVKSIKNGNKVLKTFKTKILHRKICSDKTLRKLQILLKAVVDTGSAKKIKNGIYHIAGKSGTAQTIYKNKYVPEYYLSFAGYFPIERPKYSFIIAVYNPKSFRQYGSDMSAPIVRKIADKISIYDRKIQKKRFLKMQKLEDFPRIYGGQKETIQYICDYLRIPYNKLHSSENWIKAKIDKNKKIKFVPHEISKVYIPNLENFTAKEAIYILETKNIKTVIIGSGNIVKKQSIIKADDNNIESVVLYL